MSKHYHDKALAAGMMLFAISLYAQAPTMNTFILEASAKDGIEDSSHESEDSHSSGSDSNEDKNDDKNDDKNESAKKAAEKQREADKKAQERVRESQKKSNESTRSSSSSRGRDHAEDDNDNNGDDDGPLHDINDDSRTGVDDDSGGDDDGPGHDINDDSRTGQDNHGNRGQEESRERNSQGGISIAAVTKRIAQAEEYINKKQADGKDVTAALEKLNQAKSLLATLDPAAPKTQETEALLREALKLAHDGKEALHGNNDVEKFIRKAAERISKANEKLARLIAAGGNAATYQAMIDVASNDLGQARTLLSQNNLADAVVAAQKSEDEAKSAKRAIESALLALGISDDDLSGDHKSAVSQAVDDLLFVANASDDEKLGSKVREIARSQRDSAEKVDGLVDDAQSRSKTAEFLLGPKYGDLDGLSEQISANQTRIQALTQVVAQISDPELKAVVQEHIDVLTQENSKLSSFVAGKEQTRGVFGWVFRLFHS